ncbi:zinc metallopeptidase [Hyphococcus flavus]|uniref:Zinc metallopeptidase n=1 Tax=Hyphococcus flavus TaxID=1866326 RepID=A0AAE9ZHU9_9PROT|nr:neutral zinc metallopeptidase [Hyphococcus flavus]WDI33137.1 zinc metallopeptidase [Hyphococcus flavus]
MVKWRGRRQSRNVEDRRGAAAAGGAGIILMLLRFIIGRFGIRGIILLVLIGGGLYMAGVNPLALLQGQTGTQQVAEPVDDETSQFVRVILAETEDVWSQLFAEAGGDYPEPTLVMFSGSVSSACGYASAAVGPFYCPADQKLYLDASFFQELAQRFGAPGDFAAAYVIAHEVGHHVQTVTGISNQVRSAQQRAQGEGESNALQVRMELQADCYAGVWAHYADRTSNLLDDGDIEEGLAAAEAIGDDTLQRNAGRRVTPESFTHGTSAQRQRWFTNGYRTGDVAACDTFNVSVL